MRPQTSSMGGADRASDRPPDRPPERLGAPRWAAVRAATTHWTRVTGAQVLVVDPAPVDPDLVDGLANRGACLTWVASTLDGLVELGRRDPVAVVVAPETPGASSVDFVRTVHELGTAVAIAGLSTVDDPLAGALLLAGASAVVARPYSATTLWQVLVRHVPHLDERLCLSLGPIELDAAAYTVAVGDTRIGDLPLKEFELLRALLHRAPEVLADQDVRVALWGGVDAGPSDNAIHVHVRRLRRRLDGVARIRRVRGRGYSLTLE